MSEASLHNIAGLYIDSPFITHRFKEIMKKFGGQGLSLEHVPEKMPEFKRHIDFIIIHNYILSDRDVMLQMCKRVPHVIIIKRTNIQPDLAKDFRKLHRDLWRTGAVLTTGSRIGTFENFIENQYSVKLEDH